jgi:AraC-like DNA-binding protein
LDFIIHGANVIELYYQMGQYDKMTEWIARTESALRIYEQHGDSALIHEYKGHLAIWRAILLQNTGRQHEAASVYNAIPHSCFVNQFVVSSAITYLHDAGRNAEIAELYDLLDSTYYSNDGAKMNFDNICYRLTPRYMANLKAGRIDDALKIGAEICEAIDSAVVWQRKDEAAELAVIYQTHEKEMALEESKAETRIHRLLLIGITLICMLIGYLLWRSRRYNRILASKNRKLFAEIEQNRHEQQQEIAQLQAAPLEELSTEQQLYRRICTLMDEQKPYTDETLNRDALAQILCTNAKYVEQAIRQCSKGETVSDYINRYRLEHVARLLKNTNNPIAVIGEISGIPSRATLGRLFRIAYGMTPSEYRNTTPKY